MRTSLYRHFGPDKELLYVGVSLNHVARLAQHSSLSDWANTIETVTIEYFDSRELALEAETLAIRSETPTHNIRKNIYKDKDDDMSSIKRIIRDEESCLIYRTTTLKALYKLNELKEFGLSSVKATTLIEEGILGALKIPRVNSNKGYSYHVSGWQILTFLEFAHKDGWVYK